MILSRFLRNKRDILPAIAFSEIPSEEAVNKSFEEIKKHIL